MRERFLTRRRMVLGGAGCVVLVVVGGASLAWMLFSAWRGSREVPVTLGDVRVTVVFEKAHPFLAEYTRSAKIVTGDGAAFVVPLPDDIGGGMPMEVRLHRGEPSRTVVVFTGVDDAAIDLATRERFRWDEGKSQHYTADDPRLPPIVASATIGEDFAVRESPGVKR